MSGNTPFSIDFSKKFPNLRHAPIVEAVIHWQARASKEWNPDELRAELTARLTDFPVVKVQHHQEIRFEAHIGDESPPQASERTTWQGFRLESPDRHVIAQFTRDGLAFSRLAPYETWESFEAEARRVWAIFVALAAPLDIQRLGVRFINRIDSAKLENLAEYLNEPPSLAAQLPLSEFLYQSKFDVPGHDFGIRVGKTMQPENIVQNQTAGLIIDIDVFTNRPLLCDDGVIGEHLSKMRWLKNHVFFTLLTSKAIQSFM